MSSASAFEGQPAPKLIEAIQGGDLILTKSLFQGDAAAKPFLRDKLIYQVAILATRHNHPSILFYCFSEGMLLNHDNVDNSLIYAANDSQSIPIFEILVTEGGWHVNQYLELEGDALTSAAITGDRNQGDSGQAMLRLLLKYGANVKGTGALIAAAETRNEKAVQTILEMRAGEVDLKEVEEYGTYDERKRDDMGTALYKAAAGGWLHIVDILRKEGADKGFKDRKGRSVMDVARENGREDVIKRLEET
ncbi:MAG: hypothetical protein Q9195_000468 [Heterodermia aff. obscurata]